MTFTHLTRDLIYLILQFTGHIKMRTDAAACTGKRSPYQWQLRKKQAVPFRSLIITSTLFMLAHICLVFKTYTWSEFMFDLQPASRLWAHVCTMLLRHGPMRDGTWVQLVYQRYAFSPHCGIMYYRSDVHPIMVRTLTLMRTDEPVEDSIRLAIDEDYALLQPPTSRQLSLLQKFRERAAVPS